MQVFKFMDQLVIGIGNYTDRSLTRNIKFSIHRGVCPGAIILRGQGSKEN